MRKLVFFTLRSQKPPGPGSAALTCPTCPGPSQHPNDLAPSSPRALIPLPQLLSPQPEEARGQTQGGRPKQTLGLRRRGRSEEKRGLASAARAWAPRPQVLSCSGGLQRWSRHSPGQVEPPWSAPAAPNTVHQSHSSPQGLCIITAASQDSGARHTGSVRPLCGADS